METEARHFYMMTQTTEDQQENIMKFPQPSLYREAISGIPVNYGLQTAKYAAAHDDGFMSLAVGESDLATPDFVREASTAAMERGETFYSPMLGRMELRQAMADYYRDIYDYEMPASRVAITPSGTAALRYAFTALIDPGDEVVVVSPLWRNLLGVLELQQGVSKEVALELKEAGKWELDVQKLMDACGPKTKAILINSPSNPTGWIMEEDQMRAVMEFARARGIWIISDEVYSRMPHDGRHRAPSFLDVSEPEDRLLIVNSFSKNWSMTGWRIGWLIMPESLEYAITDIAMYSAMGPATFTQFGAIAALQQGESFVKKLVKQSYEGRECLFDRFANMPRIRASRPESSFYCFFSIEGEEDSIDFTRRLIDETGLVLAPGKGFGDGFEHFYRLCFASSTSHLDEALDRLETVINK